MYTDAMNQDSPQITHETLRPITFGDNGEMTLGHCVEELDSQGIVVQEAYLFFKTPVGERVITFIQGEDQAVEEDSVVVHRIDPQAIFDVLQLPSEAILAISRVVPENED